MTATADDFSCRYSKSPKTGTVYFHPSHLIRYTDWHSQPVALGDIWGAQFDPIKNETSVDLRF